MWDRHHFESLCIVVRLSVCMHVVGCVYLVLCVCDLCESLSVTVWFASSTSRKPITPFHCVVFCVSFAVCPFGVTTSISSDNLFEGGWSRRRSFEHWKSVNATIDKCGYREARLALVLRFRNVIVVFFSEAQVRFCVQFRSRLDVPLFSKDRG